jgi:multiple sugar transport system permease protein
VVALIWKILFTPDISILDWALGLLRLPQPAWLVDPEFALWAIIIADVWEWFPFVMLISAAACGGRKPISENSPASGGHS